MHLRFVALYYFQYCTRFDVGYKHTCLFVRNSLKKKNCVLNWVDGQSENSNKLTPLTGVREHLPEELMFWVHTRSALDKIQTISPSVCVRAATVIDDPCGVRYVCLAVDFWQRRRRRWEETFLRPRGNQKS